MGVCEGECKRWNMWGGLGVRVSPSTQCGVWTKERACIGCLHSPIAYLTQLVHGFGRQYGSRLD